MQTKTIAPARPASCFLSLRISFSQIKKMLLQAAFLLSFAFFAAPAAGQVSINAQVPTNPFSNYQVFFNVTFTTAQTGLSASNFTLTGTVTGASIQSVAGSGTSWGVTVVVSNSYQSSGTLILNMVNNTGVSPGVSGLPVASPGVTDVLYPVTGSATLTSFNANPGYAKTGDVIAINIVSDNYNINQVMGSAGSGTDFAANSGNGRQDGVSVILASGSGVPQGPLAYTWGFYTIYNTQGFGSGTSSIIFDSINPTVSISAPSSGVAAGNGSGSVSYTVTYADANFGSSNLTASGITLNTTGTATGTLGISGSGNTYTVTISNILGNGTLGISVGAGYAVDLAGNTEATGTGPSSTVLVSPNVAPSISYASPQAYIVNTPISPLTPTSSIGMTAFTDQPSASSGVALDYNGNAYTVSGGNIILNPPGNGAPVTAYSGGNAGTTNIATASISSTTSTIIFGAGPFISAMDYTNGVFQSPVSIIPEGGANLVAATHPVSGPDIAMICEGNTSQITFVTRTAGVWSAPSAIANAFTTTALAINTYQDGLMMAFVGQDNKLYYATYTGGAWSSVTPWAAPNVDMTGTGAFALDTQGNVWYSNGTSLNELTPGSTSPITITTLPAAPNAMAFDMPGNLYVNYGGLIEEIQVARNFQVNPGLTAGLSINSLTGIISGTPATLTPATNYTVTATAGSANLTAAVNIATITTPAISYGGAQNYVLGTTITPITPTSTSIMPQKYNSTPTTFASVAAPIALAVDAGGNVYVDQNNGATTGISRFPAAGGTPTPLNAGGLGPIYIDAAGNLYTSNSSSTVEFTFIMYPGGSTTTSSPFGGGAPNNKSLTNVLGLAVDQAGNVYAGGASTDGVTSTNKVYEYPNRLSQDGFFNALAIGTGFTSVSGLAADAAGNIYVSDAGAGTIDVIPANRGQWTTLVSGLGAPANICIDGAGNLYFSDNSANTISEIPAGSTTPVLIASGLGSITALAIDGQGNLFAADNTNSVIDKFYPTGGYYISPVLPSGMNFSGTTGAISGTPTAAAATTNYTIMAYNTLGSASATQSIAVTAAVPTISYTGALSFTTGEAIVPVTPTSTGVATQGYNTVPSFIDNQFGAPFAVAVDTSLNVYVADPYNTITHNLGYINNGGYFNLVFTKGIGLWKNFTVTNAQLTGVAIDSTGNVFGAKSNTVPSRFTPSTTLFTETSLPFGGPVYNLATDAHGNLFGTVGNSVQEFALNATAATTIASGFSQPTGIAVDGPGNIFVVDRGTNTLYKIPAGSPVGTGPTAVATGFNMSWQLAADGTGNIFIADGGNGAVKELPAGGGPVTTVIPDLKTPNGVAVDVNGALYVADEGFAQVRKYTPSGGYYISPSLPPGLSFNNSTGVISGTPTTATPVKDYKITAYNLSGSTQTTVRFGVVPPSSNLAGLTVSAGSLSPAFATGTMSYSVSAPYSTTQTAVTPTALDANATITVNGVAVTSGSPSAAVALSVGANTVTIVVTASDNSSTKTYTVTVTRAAPSNNAQLSSAGIGYTTDGSGNTYAIVTPIVAGVGATVTVNGTTVASGAPSTPILLSPGSNTVVITVTAQNGVTKLTYKITVMGPLSGISTLSGLTISAGTLSGAFSSNTTNYTDQVNGAVTSVTVTPTTTDPNATVTVNGTAVNSGTASGSIGLPVDDTAIPTVVTAQDGVTTTTYTITVTRLSNDAGLSGLSTSSGTLNPVFATGTTAYTELVSTAITAITLTPTTNYAGATVKVNGNTVTSGTASASIPLNIGANIINTVVTAQDGTTQTYTVTVNRLSNDATLSALTISRGSLTPFFAANTTAYADTVSNATTALTITPTVNNSNATVTVNGTIVTSGTPSASQALVAGTNVITATVTAQDGVTTMSYTVTVVRLPNIPNDASLTGLSVSNGTLTPAFASGTTAYKDTVSNATTSITVTPTISNIGETVKVNGVTVNPGTASGAIALSSGNTTITTVVTAADGVTKKTYTVIVNRISNNAYLSNLALSSGTLSPVFAQATGGYTSSVSNATFSIMVTPTVNNSNATVKVNGVLVSSGTASSSIPLAVGANTITAAVTAQDGVTKKTYTVVVTRAVGDATLSNLTINSGTLSPVFVAGTVSYTASVTNATASITVTPTVNNPNATVKVNGVTVSSGAASAAIPLALGANTITVLVTALDGVTTKSYTITITRALGDVDLTNVVLSSGTLSPVYFAGTTSYTVLVTNATTSITVTPTANNPASTIKVNNVVTTSGTASAPIALAVGNTTINMVVTAPDGVTRKTFAIVVTRPSNNAYLTNLTISTGTLSPVFVNTTSAYTTTVSNATASVTVTPTLNNPHATITVNGTPLALGATSQAISLAVGNTTINTVVIAQDGVTKKNYTITVTRPSNNAYLSNLTISSGTLSPVFAQATGGYTASVSNATATVTITPTLANPHGAITVNGATVATGTASTAIPLNVGSNAITTVVTAQDGVTHKTYTITVTRASGSLNSLYLPGSGEQTPLVSSLNEKVEANNILSPNGDGINDIWVVKNIAFYPDNTVTVYDRAGKVVFTKKGYTNDWDGTSRGSVLNEGTYYYLVDLGNGKSVKGFITVVH